MLNDMDVELFKKAVTPLLKEHGFKKFSATWRRVHEESVAVFNVQRSSWGGDTYYVNIGIYFLALGSDPAPTENKCHVQVPLEIKSPREVVVEAITWFQARLTLPCAAELAEADSKRGLVFKEVRNAAIA